ncbi:hypothetical protein [Actinoplanes sp. NPDC026670]|uniref:hypothetical protein n=1 Tax=Actinoplanes sp. NPDC026670 TaxID=3154700 RepID=UPI0033F7F9B1
MAAGRPLRADATGIAIAAGLAALLFGGVVQGFHLIAEDVQAPGGPVVSATTKPAKPVPRPPDGQEEDIQKPNLFHQNP